MGLPSCLHTLRRIIGHSLDEGEQSYETETSGGVP